MGVELIHGVSSVIVEYVESICSNGEANDVTPSRALCPGLDFLYEENYVPTLTIIGDWERIRRGLEEKHPFLGGVVDDVVHIYQVGSESERNRIVHSWRRVVLIVSRWRVRNVGHDASGGVASVRTSGTNV